MIRKCFNTSLWDVPIPLFVVTSDQMFQCPVPQGIIVWLPPVLHCWISHFSDEFVKFVGRMISSHAMGFHHRQSFLESSSLSSALISQRRTELGSDIGIF